MGYNQPGYKWYVVDVQTISIRSGWEYFEDATDAAREMVEDEGHPRGSVKVMTKPRVGGQVLDPRDDRSWEPRRNGGAERNPRFGNPAGVVKTARDERLWEEAKASAAQQGREGDWNYVMGIFKRMKTRVGGGALENPGELVIVNPGREPDTRRAEDAFRMWHQKEPNKAFVLKAGCHEGDVLVCVGHAVDIEYRSGKWQKGKKTEDYIHDFESRPKVWMLADRVGDDVGTGGREVGAMLARSRGQDGRFGVADLATPLRLGVEGPDGEFDLKIHGGARVYGAVDKKTVIVCDPEWGLVIIQGGKMHFDERGIIQ